MYPVRPWESVRTELDRVMTRALGEGVQVEELEVVVEEVVVMDVVLAVLVL